MTRTARKPPARTRGSSTRSADGDEDYENPSDPEDPDVPDHPKTPGRRRNNNRKPGRSNLAAIPPVKHILFAELLSQEGQQGLPAVQPNAIDVAVTCNRQS
jgi:hypothetical protein